MSVTFEQILDAVRTTDRLAKEFARPDQEARVELIVRTLSYAECKEKGVEPMSIIPVEQGAEGKQEYERVYFPASNPGL